MYIYIYRHSLSSFLLTLWQGCKVPGPKVYYRLVSFWICFLQAAADPSNLRPLEPGQALYQSASQDQAILAHSHQAKDTASAGRAGEAWESQSCGATEVL